MEMDEWDAMTVEITDSASALGRGNHRKKIDRWHRIRGPPLRTPQKDVWTVERDIEAAPFILARELELFERREFHFCTDIQRNKR